MNKTLQLLAFAIFAIVLPGYSAEEPLEIGFEAHRVTVDEKTGKESLEAAETAFPGDVIQYSATYSNRSENPLKDVRPVIPVPRGMVVDLQSARPRPTEASLDGVRFSPMPLLDEEGKPVAAEKIRALRWHVPLLGDNPAKISFRVKVES